MCDSLNERSRRAALRLGFTFEGIFRQHMIVKGRNRDTAWFAIMDHEWPSVRARLETANHETFTKRQHAR
jgi:RimJ/RimL family protein N-acetyltransferase